MYYNSIIETIGNTPLVRFNNINKGIAGTMLAKVEYFNPGHSVKDRIGIKMIEDAEKDGRLKPGGTIIEGTSGNTGMGLALAGIVKGYKCVFVTTDKQSQEKINILKALGADVIVCPTGVAPSDPRSYYSTAERLSKETPNSFYPNQYDNLSNTKAHYETTGPEIWEQTEGKITHFVAGVGTGGTISGVSKYLREKNPDIKVIGVDTYGSVFKKYKETGEFDEKEIYPYMTEGIGEDILPANVKFDMIDEFIKVTDKDAAIMARKISRIEGIFVGWSCGAAVHGALEYARKNLKDGDTMVVLLPDHGTRYLNKIYNDTWMENHGFLETRDFAKAKDIVGTKEKDDLVTIDASMKVADAVHLLTREGLSQIPVTENGRFVGSLTDTRILTQMIQKPEIKSLEIREVMDEPFPFVSTDSTLDVLFSLINKDARAILVRDSNGEVHILTQADLLEAATNMDINEFS